MTTELIDDVLPTNAIAYWGFLHARFASFHSHDKSGKWCILRTADTVDETWVAIREAVRRNELPAAIVSTPAQAATHGGSYVICVFTTDWANKADVFAIREKLRALGVTENLNYKRDIETSNNRYGTPDEFFYKEPLADVSPKPLPRDRPNSPT